MRILQLLLLAFISTMASFAISSARETGFLNRFVTLDGVEYRYQVFVPREYSPDKKWPVILFLHGSGERGSDGLLQTEFGLPFEVRRNVSRFPCIVVLPQCPDGKIWMGTSATMALAALDSAMKEFNGDEARIYCTGLSLGGQGTWYLAAQHPDKFAAIVPVCGPIRILKQHPITPDIPESTLAIVHAPDPFGTIARRVAKIPIHIFHGDSDDVVPVSDSRTMVAELKKLGADVQYTEYPGVKHPAWEKAYADSAMIQWLFSQKRKH